MNKKQLIFGKVIKGGLIFAILTALINFFALIPVMFIGFKMENDEVSNYLIIATIIGIFIFVAFFTYLNIKIFIKIIGGNWRSAQYIFWTYLFMSIAITGFSIFYKKYSLGLFLPWHALSGFASISLLFMKQGYYIGLGQKEGIFIIGLLFLTLSFSLIYLFLRKKFKLLDN